MSHIVGGGGVTRNFAAQQAAMRVHQAHAATQRSNQHFRMMMMQQNLRLARSAVAEVVHELVEAQPTADELQLLAEAVQEAPDEIEARLRDTRLWHFLTLLRKSETRVEIATYAMLLLMIIDFVIKVTAPEPTPPPAPQVTVNVPIDTDEIAEKVAKQLEEDGVCVVPEPETKEEPKRR